MYNTLLFAGAAYTYFFPALLAVVTKHADWRGVFWCNVLFAWTIAGWFMVLIWALDTNKRV